MSVSTLSVLSIGDRLTTYEVIRRPNLSTPQLLIEVNGTLVEVVLPDDYRANARDYPLFSSMTWIYKGTKNWCPLFECLTKTTARRAVDEKIIKGKPVLVPRKKA